ncbi:MAG: hypothetical protein NUV98_07545 [Candidatus Roizmanbacteria bacterium]|nr:hypothetical protein [Candidatus Roizmanbacteria bacterium]
MLERLIKRFRRESIVTPELPETFPVYSGTTLQNYKTSTYVTSEGVFYDKLRNPKHWYKETYFFDVPEHAYEHAKIIAFELQDLPVVMGGNISITYQGGRDRLPAGTLFPVSHLWILRGDITSENLLEKLLARMNYETLKSNFIEVEPASVLE